MGIRYDNRNKRVNQEEIHEEFMESRDVLRIKHYTTPTIPHLTREKRMRINAIQHIWKTGDSYWKLAYKYYKDQSLWWLIAWYNQKPTEAHVKMGEVIIIPTPLERILRFYYRE